MIDKIILGTANFTQLYGVLSSNNLLTEDHVTCILNKAINSGICKLDTALGYGDVTKFLSHSMFKELKIITKMSVLDSKDTLVEKMDIYKGLSMYGLLIHDPCKLNYVNENELLEKIAFLRQRYGIEKIGVSAYDMEDIEDFSRICTPEIVQIPLNPLNQSFEAPCFIEWVQNNKVEVHGRSLFLQGILLANELPKKLEPMQKEWSLVRKNLEHYHSPLHGLLLWAASKTWVHHWVIGVSSLKDLDEIFEASSLQKDVKGIPIFQSSNHSLADPRNWN